MKGPSFFHISKTLSHASQQEMPVFAQKILEQPFFYWGKGSQSYVFLSEDQQFVLKFARAGKAREGLLDRILQRKGGFVFCNSLRIAELLTVETALIYAHHGEGHVFISERFRLFDRLRHPLRIDLEKVPFALQYRKPLLSQVVAQASPEEGKNILRAFLTLIARELEKGWMSRDNAFQLNFGYEGGAAWRIDLGSYCPKDELAWKRATKPVLHWLKETNHPLYDWFEQEVRIYDTEG